MTVVRPPIPEGMKREVRQRCGFGCVVCGLPIYDYEHMEEWSKVERHVADEITLLCPNHHRERTAGLLPIERVKAFNAAPRNRRTGESSAHPLHFFGTTVNVHIGRSTFFRSNLTDGDVLAALVVDGTTLIGFRYESGALLLTLRLADESGTPILTIEDSELVYSTGVWDVERVGTKLRVRMAPRQAWIEMDFLAPDLIRINRAKVLHNGVAILVTRGLMVDAHSLATYEIDIGEVPFGIVIGDSDQCVPAGVMIDVQNRGSYSFEKAEKFAREVSEQAPKKTQPTAVPRSVATQVRFDHLDPIQRIVDRWALPILD